MTIKNPINYPLNKCLSSNQPRVPTNWNPAEHDCQVANKEPYLLYPEQQGSGICNHYIDWLGTGPNVENCKILNWNQNIAWIKLSNAWTSCCPEWARTTTQQVQTVSSTGFACFVDSPQESKDFASVLDIGVKLWLAFGNYVWVTVLFLAILWCSQSGHHP